MIIKTGELSNISSSDIHTTESVVAELGGDIINDQFTKFAAQLKRIAPKADDFLYFSAVMMHAAEAALINDDGSPKLTSKGEVASAHWEQNGESVKWISNDSNIRPYKNSNGDIFPEKELLKAKSGWISKPLCVDHKSSNAESIRGIILDVVYDRKFKRLIALCCVDKISFPQLANGIRTGYQNNFSMGTAVGKAVCFDCGVVAKTERDFCNHMKTKSCYGEINLDLQPIEFSVVTTPADKKAKLRTIIAAAQSIHSSISAQETDLSQLSSTANLSTEQISKLHNLEQDLRNISDKFMTIKKELESTEHNIEATNTSHTPAFAADDQNSAISPPYGQSSGMLNPPIDEINQQEVQLNLPQRFASGNNEVLLGELKILKASIEDKLDNMEKTLLHLKQEDKMADKDTNMGTMDKQAYWQGAGGVNEPAPKQVKYPIDPKNEHLREKEDKQMVGQTPFPGVGSVDGMHPSPQSADQKDELERKKMLLRAETEQRALRRAGALQKAKENLMTQKEAYWQGGGGVNEPEPGKAKYTKDPLNEKDREKEDRQMVGQKPFPGVGDVESLHPSPLSADEKDELKRKVMLQRASLKARWTKVANPDGTNNLGASGWQIFLKDAENGDRLVLTASVDEITGGRSEALYDMVATKEFATKMLDKIRTVGLKEASAVYKKGQAVAGPGSSPSAPPDAVGANEVPPMQAVAPVADVGAPSEDEGGKGDPKETALKLAEKARDTVSDLLEAVRSLTGEQAEMGEMGENLEALPKAANMTLKPLFEMRKELHNGLFSGMKKSIAELKEHTEELNLIANFDVENSTNKDYTQTLVDDAFADATRSIEDAEGLKQAYEKYVRGTSRIKKRAEEARKSALRALGNSDKTTKTHESTDENDVSYVDDVNEVDSNSSTEDFMNADDELNADFEDDGLADDENLNEGMHMDEEMDHELFPAEHDDSLESLHEEGSDFPDELNADDVNDTMVELPAGAPVPQGAKAVPEKMASFNLATKEGRASYRAKLAADATGKETNVEPCADESTKFSDMLDQADSLANGQTKLDTKPSDNLGRVETPAEVHKRVLEVARMGPPKVRKEAERLNELIVNGEVDAADLDKLVARGLDADVVKYWRQFWGGAGKEGSEFAKLLTTETMKAKAAEEMLTFRVKLARSYELANEMVRRGLCTDERTTINAQVDEIMKWNDEAFESYKRIIAKHAPLSMKKESSIPQIGMIGSGDPYAGAPVELDFQSELDQAFSGRKY